jgi:acyl-CoA dehydrogenase
MDFELTPKAQALREELLRFMDERVYPAEAVYREQMRAGGEPTHHPQILEDLKEEARRRGLWNLFLPHRTEWTEGLSNAEYAPLAEISGRSAHLAPEAMNCSAPDTGNMELLTMFGTPEQQDRWLRPLLEGEIRSCFAMTEPDVASSDATNIQTEIRREGDEYVINGRKWWASGAGNPRCRVAILMGKTDPDARTFQQQSMILVPLDTPGITKVRDLPVFGYLDRETHAELLFEDVRVPAENLLGPEGGGFMMAQARLGPGRIHHCMRSIGVGERALELLVRRAVSRTAFGRTLAEQGVVQDGIAESRLELDQARQLCLYAAWLMDTAGNKAARNEISAIKVVAPRAALNVVDRAIQVHGGAGVSDDVPLAEMYAGLRTLRLADGPDEVHKMVIARREIVKHLPPEAVEAMKRGRA